MILFIINYFRLELSILSGDENIDAELKVNPKSDNGNECVIVHMIHELTLDSTSIFSPQDEIDNSKCNISTHIIFI